MQKKPSDPTQLSLFGEVENTDLMLATLEDKKVRKVYFEKEGKWYFCVVDLVEVLSNSLDPSTYWSQLKGRLSKESGDILPNWKSISFPLKDDNSGRWRKMDAVDMEGALRLAQSIPSPKAEPLKRWLAKVGNERIEETIDPELGVNRSIERSILIYKKRGHTDRWIAWRLKATFKRNDLTDYLKYVAGFTQGWQYSGVTNAMYKTLTGGFTAADLRKQMNLKEGANVRDYMTDTGLMLTEMMEGFALNIAEARGTTGYKPMVDVSEEAANIVKTAKLALEKATGVNAITGKPLLSA